MENLRCLISDIPQQLLSDIILSIAQRQENIEVVERVPNTDELDSILNNKSIDVLILGLKSNSFPDICKDLLDKFSDLLILGLFDDGRHAAVFLDDVGTHEIVKIISTFGKRDDC